MNRPTLPKDCPHNRRWKGFGPKFVKWGKTIKYPVSEYEKWTAEDPKYSSTSEISVRNTQKSATELEVPVTWNRILPIKGQLNSKQVAEAYQVPVETLVKQRELGEGPPYYKKGRHVRYCSDEIQTWERGETKTFAGGELRERDVKLFWDKVAILDEDDCWNWTASYDTNGYGAFRRNSKKYNTHRVSLAIKLDLPLNFPGDSCHTCDNRSCVNPKHLYQGTRQQNVQDQIDRGRFARGEQAGQAIRNTEEALIIKFMKPLPTRKLAVVIGRSRATVREIQSERMWNHLTQEMADNLKEVLNKNGISPVFFLELCRKAREAS